MLIKAGFQEQESAMDDELYEKLKGGLIRAFDRSVEISGWIGDDAPTACIAVAETAKALIALEEIRQKPQAPANAPK
jgi:hypothetical protein